MFNYQRISSTKSFGGGRVVFTGQELGISSGRYDATLADLPDRTNGCLPTGTPILMDDHAKTIKIHYAFEVYEAVSYLQNATSVVVKLRKQYEGSRAKVGMIIGLAPTTATGEVAMPLTITAIDRTNESYDSVTCSCSAASANGTIALAATLVEVEENDDDNKFYIKVLPNAFTFYDVVKHPDAQEVFFDGVFCQPDGVLLTRRIPPIADCIKEYLRGEGNVYMRYSTSEE